MTPTCADPQGTIWDVVVIGTGAGGATAGFDLARRGRSVLFIERGKPLDEDALVQRGVRFAWDAPTGAAVRYGWWPRQPVRSSQIAAQIAADPAVGCGTGGSTALFSMLMDRMWPQDFTPRRFVSGVSATSLPMTWPIACETLEPFYEEAERVYRVRGTADPLLPGGGRLLEPPPPSGKEDALFEVFTDAGLHPYRMHYACEQLDGCAGCLAMLCPRECRNDAARMCLRPAIQQHNAQLVTECRVVRLEEEGRSVRRAICEWKGRPMTARGRVFVLAANAFLTPALLHRSANDRFPNGLANSSGMVGKNLMLHVSDVFALKFKRPPAGADGGLNHGISLNDFYVDDGTKLGSIHAHARCAPVFPRLHSTSTVFATVLEDSPYPENRVRLSHDSGDSIVYDYRYPAELRQRNTRLLQAFKTAVRSHFDVELLRPAGQLNMTHVCGTCRFGDDPRTSVLDSDNRARDLDNMYITDASFFPSSGGINPSLTIAANSLRVSAAISRRL